MLTRNYQIYGTSGTANSANVQILEAGVITSVSWDIFGNSITDNDAIYGELSFQSTSQLTTNNAQNIISTISGFTNLVTSGMTVFSLQKVDLGLYIPVGIGVVVYMNLNINNAVLGVKAIVRVTQK